MTADSQNGGGAVWTRRLVALAVTGVVIGILVRIAILPSEGFRGDLNQFVEWVHGLATHPFGLAYDQSIGFPPVMVYIWGLMAAIQPGFQTATDSSDVGIRVLMKLPATIADFGLAAAVGYALRERPRLALSAAIAILLHPAVIDVSAWWGQYESIYVLAAVVAFLFAVADRPGPAAVALAIALMTKPQALPFLVPFAAWFLARYGLAATIRLGAIGAATIGILWLPFLPAGGPLAYARNLAQYQGEVFSVLSLQAWNPWWLVQEAFGQNQFISDAVPIAGPVTLRLFGYVVTALLELVVFAWVWRSPTPRSLALGLMAATLVAFIGLTSMHERYAYPAIVFVLLALPHRQVALLWFVVSLLVAFNILAASAPTPEIARVLPDFGTTSVVGSIALTLVTFSVLGYLRSQGQSGMAT